MNTQSIARFNWQDPFLLEDQLSEEERMIRDTAAAFAQDVLQPRVESAYMEETSDPELFRLMGETGVRGVTEVVADADSQVRHG